MSVQVERTEHFGYIVFEFEPTGNQVANFRLQAKDHKGYDYILTASRIKTNQFTHKIEATTISHRTNLYVPVAWYLTHVRLAKKFELLSSDELALRVVRRMANWVGARIFDDQPDWAYCLKEAARQVVGEDYYF